MRSQNLIIFLVVFGAFMITFVRDGILHSFGLYLIPITEYLNIGREVFGFAFAKTLVQNYWNPVIYTFRKLSFRGPQMTI